MAPHSSTLAWKIPRMEEPRGLQPLGSWTVGHDWAISLSRTGEGNGNPLQCSCLENPRDGGAWWAAAYGVAQSRTRLKHVSSSSSWPGAWVQNLTVYHKTRKSCSGDWYKPALSFLYVSKELGRALAMTAPTSDRRLWRENMHMWGRTWRATGRSSDAAERSEVCFPCGQGTWEVGVDPLLVSQDNALVLYLPK